MSAPKRQVGRPRAFDPEQSLDRAVRVFWQKGYFGASLDDLTQAMGINRPSLYATFGDKQALFLQCVDRYASTIGKTPMSVLMTTPEIHLAISDFFKAVVELASDDNNPKGCLIACILTECSEAIPEARDRLATAITGSDQAIEQRLLRAIQARQLTADFPVRARARLATSLMHGIALRARSHESKPALIEFAQMVSELILTL